MCPKAHQHIPLGKYQKCHLRRINIDGKLDFEVVIIRILILFSQWISYLRLSVLIYKIRKTSSVAGEAGAGERFQRTFSPPQRGRVFRNLSVSKWIYVCSRVRSLGTKSSAQEWGFLFALFYAWPDPSPASSKVWSLVACLFLWNNYAFGNTDGPKKNLNIVGSPS